MMRHQRVIDWYRKTRKIMMLDDNEQVWLPQKSQWQQQQRFSKARRSNKRKIIKNPHHWVVSA
jgi:hypothetical protein